MAERNGNKPATKSDIHKLDARIGGAEQRHTGFDRLMIEIARMNSRIDRLEHSLRQEMRDNTGRILVAIDAVARKTEAYDRKTVSHGAIIQDHEALLMGHERRMKLLESEP